MKLTSAERLIIIMLCDIQKHFKINGDVDPNLVSDAIFGHSWALNWEYASLSEENTDSDDPAVIETADILQMYTTLKNSYDKLDGAAQGRLKAKGVFASNFEFPGFDGNHDKHYGIARFMVTKLKRFSEYTTNTLNSHDSSSISTYRRMIPKYESAIKASHGGALSEKAIEDIMI